MLLIDQFRFIKSRDDFFRVLDEAIQETLQLLQKGPPDPHLESILVQLDAIKRWTANDREPTEAERESTTIGPVLFREFEPAANDEMYEWITKVREVNAYFQDWLDDATFATIDEDDLD